MLINHDIDFVKSILPDHYIVKESERRGSIHCESAIGIPDTPPEDHWKAVFGGIKGRFGYRFQEVYHSTCANHVNFTIYLK
jgi:hypothetical protein